MTQNFFAPAFEVQINGARLSADISKYITSLSVVLETNSMNQCTVTLANPYPKMRWTHTDDAKLFQEGNELKVRLGYVDDLHELFDGEITQINLDFPESGTPTVRITGHTRLHRLQAPHAQHAPFLDVTDKQIVEEIAKAYGFTVEAEETETRYEFVAMQNNQSNLDFLHERAKLIHFELAVEGKKLFFRKVKNDQSPVYTLVWGTLHQDVAQTQNVLPLKSFTPTLNTRDQVSEVIVRGQNPTTREIIEGRASSGDEDSTMGGTRPGPQVAAQAFGRPNQLVLVNLPVATEEEARQQAKAIYNKRALSFVTGAGSSIGLPALRAGQVIRLEGLGSRFTGDYYVKQVTHTINTSGYLTTFEVQRNAIS